MEWLALIRRCLIGLAGTALGFAALVTVARADDAAFPTGLIVHGPEETLRDHCAFDDDGRLWLTVPGGARFELVTSVHDPVITHPGDGAFHPFDVAEVRAAIAEVRYPLRRIRAEIFLLPYPRRGGVESAAAPGLILLAPGVRPIAREHQHYETVHELGHVVQYTLMPERDTERWAAYRALRGIEDPAVYGPGCAHANRPREIFAEDFRALYGGKTANFSGTIENPDLPHPSAVDGLSAFLLALAGDAPLQVAVRALPNPSRGDVRFTRSGGDAVALDVFDLSGRRVATLPPAGAGGQWEWRWDGRDLAGREVSPGTYFARPRDGGHATARITRLP